MSLLPEEKKDYLKNEFAAKLENSIRLLMFTQTLECQYCAETRQLVQELATLNDKIKVEIYDFLTDADKAKSFGIDKVPAIVIMGEKDYGIKIYGFPFGYKFPTLKEAIITVSKRKTDLSDQTKARLKEVKTPVHIQVFVTLTCPHCPIAAVLAHKFAMENDLIKTDVIDAGEFPHLSLKYGVMGVPKTVINEKIEFIGAIPEDLFLEHVLLAVV